MMGRKWLVIAAILCGWGWSGHACSQDVDQASAGAEESVSEPGLPKATPTPTSDASSEASDGAQVEEPAEEMEQEVPWDYDPYRVLVWIASDDPNVTVANLEAPLRAYLERDFAAVWRLDLANAPATVRTAAIRDIGGLSYDQITAADPILAVKRDHPDAVRIRTAKNVGEFVSKVHSTGERIAEVVQRASAAGNESLDGVKEKLTAIEGDAMAVRDLWSEPDTEALLMARGLAMTLSDPQAKLITPTIDDLVGNIIEQYDKIFIVRLRTEVVPLEVQVVEFDTLMRHFGPVAKTEASVMNRLYVAIGRGLTKAFAPVLRIENAGQRSAVGLLRAGGLIVEEDRERSPAYVRVGDVFEPMTRKNDRNDDPILVGPLDWAYLHVTGLSGHEGRNVDMDFYAGRAGGLQGRKNKRTFRTALKVRPFGESTVIRLHLQRDPDFHLIGYELYDKELDSGNMTFVGRTDWNGRLLIERSGQPLRLLYVKNGGAVLARLPIVPGLYDNAVADLSGDDLRLEAEAYIRGVQNSIVDLVAVRELFKARIRLRLERGEMKKAEDLLNALLDQPSNANLSDEIGKKHSAFINMLGSGNANQRRKVDEMFTTTRELLAKHINPNLERELEADVRAAAKNGGKLPTQSAEPEASEADAEQADAEAPPAEPPGEQSESADSPES